MQLILAGPIDWSRLSPLVPAALLAFVNTLAFLYITGPIALLGSRPVDLEIMQRAAVLAGEPALYDYSGTSTFVWSPVAAYALQPLATLDPWAWRAVLIGGALAMPTWPLRAALLVAWPFWMDLATGNLVTLIFLSAVWALRGSALGTFAFFTLALLIPRPLLAPLGLWILWKRPEWRIRVAALVGVNVVLVLWTGLTDEWLSAVAAVGPLIQESGYNMGPSRFVGWWWLLAGMPLAAWLSWRGRLGWAGLALSPYIWSYYFLFVLPPVNRAPDVGRANGA